MQQNSAHFYFHYPTNYTLANETEKKKPQWIALERRSEVVTPSIKMKYQKFEIRIKDRAVLDYFQRQNSTLREIRKIGSDFFKHFYAVKNAKFATENLAVLLYAPVAIIVGRNFCVQLFFISMKMKSSVLFAIYTTFSITTPGNHEFCTKKQTMELHSINPFIIFASARAVSAFCFMHRLHWVIDFVFSAEKF